MRLLAVPSPAQQVVTCFQICRNHDAIDDIVAVVRISSTAATRADFALLFILRESWVCVIAVSKANQTDALAVQEWLGVLSAVRAVVNTIWSPRAVSETMACWIAATTAGGERDLRPFSAGGGVGKLGHRDLVLGAVDVLQPLHVVLCKLQRVLLEAFLGHLALHVLAQSVVVCDRKHDITPVSEGRLARRGCTHAEALSKLAVLTSPPMVGPDAIRYCLRGSGRPHRLWSVRRPLEHREWVLSLRHPGRRPAPVRVPLDATTRNATARAQHRRHAWVTPRHHARPVPVSAGHVDVVRAVLLLVERRLARDDRDLRLLLVGLREQHARAVERVPSSLGHPTCSRVPGHGVRLLAEAACSLPTESPWPGLAGQPLACGGWVVHLTVGGSEG
jgi:hypothetical protein